MLKHDLVCPSLSGLILTVINVADIDWFLVLQGSPQKLIFIFILFYFLNLWSGSQVKQKTFHFNPFDCMPEWHASHLPGH